MVCETGVSGVIDKCQKQTMRRTHTTYKTRCKVCLRLVPKNMASFAYHVHVSQEIIPVGCVLPSCLPYVFKWSTPDVHAGGMGIGPQVNKFEQVCSDDHQMSVAVRLG